MTFIGLKKSECESFVEDGILYHICAGNITQGLDMPVELLQLRKEELKNDHEAQISLNNLFVIGTNERLLQFCKCRYGGYDKTPDTTTNNNNNTPDYWNCGYRGKCKEEFNLCRPVMAANGRLFRAEIEVIKLIAQDLADKQIADILKVSNNTIHTHRYNITKKIGCNSKNGIVAFAYEKGITL